MDANIMSSFKTHRRFNYLIFIIGCLILNHFNLFNVYIMTTIGIGFIIGTELITPDLDTASTPSHRVGWIWLPYRLAFKHRGVSHNPFLGFISRILYIALIIGLLCILFSVQPAVTPELLIIVAILVAGIAVANGLHILLDRVV